MLFDADGNTKILTPSETVTGKYVPQNFSDKPYNLNNFPAAPDSLDKTKKAKK